MANIITSAQFTIADLTDALIQNTAPSNPQEGMLWINTTTVPFVMYVYKEGIWKVVGADGDKSKVFTNTPITPYNKGDLWVKVGSKEIFVCTIPKLSGTFNQADWMPATDYGNSEALNNFIQNTYNIDKKSINERLDGKIDILYRDTDPATDWVSDEDKKSHIGDLWYNTTEKLMYRYSYDADTGTYEWLYMEDKNLKLVTESLDNKIETYYQAQDPSVLWQPDTKENHIGDLWYKEDTKEMFRYNKNTLGVFEWLKIDDKNAVDAMALASEAKDTADSKRQVYTGNTDPTVPYDIGDLWYNPSLTGEKLKVCTVKKTASDTYSSTDWSFATGLHSFISDTYATDVESLKSQIDGKVETFFQEQDPELNWNSQSIRSYHVGDLWYYIDSNSNNKLKIYREVASGVYGWKDIKDADVVDAYKKASEAQLAADGKCTVFYISGAGNPNPPYDIGDLWVKGNSGATMVCTTKKVAGEAYSIDDWTISDNTLNDFINTTYTENKNSLQSQIDGKIETFYQAIDPSESWATTQEKEKHIGDIWYNTANKRTSRYRKKTTDSFEWQHLEESNESLNNFINTTYNEKINALQNQIDNKIETFFQENDPSTDWTNDTVKLSHVGDIWYNSKNGQYKLQRYSPAYVWEAIQDKDTINAYELASKAKDTADNKRRVFVGTASPTVPYDIGDLWVQGNGGDILVSNANKKESELFDPSDWGKASNYKPYQIHTGNTPPDDTTLLWMDTTDTSKPILKTFEGGKWISLSSASTVNVFTSTTVAPPYNVGDIWVYTDKGKTYIRVCITAKEAGGSFAHTDWVEQSADENVIKSTEAPADTNKFWIDISDADSPILKSYDGEKWVVVGEVTDLSQINANILNIQNSINSLESSTNNQLSNLNQQITQLGTNIENISNNAALQFSITDYEQTINTINGQLADLQSYKEIQSQTFKFDATGFTVGSNGSKASVKTTNTGVEMTDEKGAKALSITSVDGVSAPKMHIKNSLRVEKEFILGKYKFSVADNGSFSISWIG